MNSRTVLPARMPCRKPISGNLQGHLTVHRNVSPPKSRLQGRARPSGSPPGCLPMGWFSLTAKRMRLHSRQNRSQQRRIGVALGKRQPDLARRDSDLGSDLQQFQADRPALRPREGDSREGDCPLLLPNPSPPQCPCPAIQDQVSFRDPGRI